MTYAPNSMFFGKINNTNPTELVKKIDYTKTKLEDRKDVVKDILETGFYEEYFDEHFKVGLNSTDALSEFDNACNSLDRLANYLLNSDEVKEDKKETEYKFYSDEDSFQAAIKKEVKIDGMGSGNDQDNVIHFLKKENRNYKKDKTQFISTKDINRVDELGEIIRDYVSFLRVISEDLKNKDSKVSRYLLTKTSGAIKQDMILCKDIILGVFGYRTNASESTVIDWDLCDFTNPEHVKALLYFNPEFNGNEELKYIIIDFVELLSKIKLTELQQEIILLMRRDKNPTEISRILNVTRKAVYDNVNSVVNRICNQAKQV